MWTKSHSIITREVTKEQMWKLFSDVNNWPNWDKSVTYSSLEGPFEKGNHFLFQPEGGPKLTLAIEEAIENKNFTDCTSFPMAKMYGAHTFEDTADGLKITTTMTVKGFLSFLWVQLVAKKIVADLPKDMVLQINTAKLL